MKKYEISKKHFFQNFKNFIRKEKFHYNLNMLKLTILFLLKCNLIQSSIVSIFENKYDIVSSNYHTTSSAFSSLNFITSIENLDFLRCLRICNNYGNCFSVINTKFNNSYSLCSLYNNYSTSSTDLILIQNVIISQKISFRKSIVFNLIFFVLRV